MSFSLLGLGVCLQVTADIVVVVSSSELHGQGSSDSSRDPGDLGRGRRQGALFDRINGMDWII